MLAITACLALPIELKPTHPGLWMLVFAALLTLWSMGTYLKAAWPHLLPSVKSPIQNDSMALRLKAPIAARFLE